MRATRVTLPIDDREREWIEVLRISARLASEADVLRLGVQHLARHYGADLPLDLFVIDGQRRRRRAAR